MRWRRTLRYGQRVMPCSRHRCFRTVTHSPSWIDGGGGGGASVEGSRAAGQVLDAPRLKFSLTLRATSFMGRWKFALSSSSVRLFDCPLPRFCEV